MANAVIGALRVVLGANTAAFDKGLKSAQGGMARFSKAMKVGAAAAAAALTAALAGVSLAIRGVLNHADEMGKAAQRIGVPVEEFTRLRHAAEMSGASVGDLENGLRRLGRNMADTLQNPTSKTAQAFERLGVSVTDANGRLRPTSEVLSDIAQQISQMPDGAEKTAMAFDLLGRNGTALIPMLNQGRDGLQAMKDEADELGITIDSKTAAAAERFNDGLSRLGRMLSGIWTKLTAELAPALAAIVEYFVDAARESNGFGSTIKTVAQGAVNAALAVMDGWHRLKLVWPALEVAARMFGQTLVEIARQAAVTITGIVDTLISGINKAVAGMNEMLGTSVGLLDTLGESEWFDRINRNADEAAMGLARARLRLGMLMDQPLPSEGIREAIAGFGEVKESADSAAISIEGLNEGMARAAGGGGRAAAGVGALKDATDEAAKSGQQLAQTLAGQFSNMFNGLISGTQSASDAIKGLLNQLSSMLMNRVFQSLFMQGSGGGGGFLSSIFGGFRAKGGPVGAGRSYVVGERGPELFVPNTSGTVVSNDNLNGGGQLVHVTVGWSRNADGNLKPFVEQVSGQTAGNIVAAASPRIVEQSTTAAGGALARGDYDRGMSRYGVSRSAKVR